MDCSLSGSSVHGILQARILEWVAVPFSKGSSWPRDWTRSPEFQVDSLPSESPGEPLNSSTRDQNCIPCIGRCSLNHWTARVVPSSWVYITVWPLLATRSWFPSKPQVLVPMRAKLLSLQLCEPEPTRLLSPWGFSRQEYWNGLSFPASGYHPNPGTEPKSLKSPALEGKFFTTSASDPKGAP